MKYFIFIFLITCAFNAFANSKYGNEISLIVKNHKALLNQADERYTQASKFRKNWSQIAFQLKLLNQSVLAYSTKLPQTKNIKENFYNEMIHESVFITRSQEALETTKESINQKIIQSQEVCKNAQWLCSLHQRNTFSITSQLNALSRILEKRKNDSEIVIKEWNERQFKSWTNEENKIHLNLIHGIETDKLISKLPLMFIRLNNRALIAFNFGNKEEALDTLAASAWLRSIIPSFFANKVLPDYSQKILDQAIKSSEKADSELRKEFLSKKNNKISRDQVLKILRAIASDDEYGWSSDQDYKKLEDKIKENNFRDQLFDIGKNINLGDNNHYSDKVTDKVANGYSIDENTTEQNNQFNINPGDIGIARIDQGSIVENVRLEKDEEIKNKIDNYLNEKVANIVSIKDMPETNFTYTKGLDFTYTKGLDVDVTFSQGLEINQTFESAHKVKDLLERSEPKISEDNIEDFQELKNEVESLQETINLLGRIVEESLSDIQIITEKCNLEVKEIQQVVNKSNDVSFKNIDSIFPLNENQSQLDLSSNIKGFDNYKDFFNNLNSSLATSESLSKKILSDVLSEIDGPSAGYLSFHNQPGKNYQEKKTNFQFGELESALKNKEAAGKKLTPIEYRDYLYKLYQIAEQNKVSKMDWQHILGGIIPVGNGFGVTLPARIVQDLLAALKLSTSLHPSVSKGVDLYAIITGRDFVTGDKLTDKELLATAVSFILEDQNIYGMFFKFIFGKYSEVAQTSGGLLKELGVFNQFFSNLSDKLLPPELINSINKAGQFLFESKSVQPVEVSNNIYNQDYSIAALQARARVQNGDTVIYRTNGNSAWTIEYPMSAGYGQKFGISEDAMKHLQFIESGRIKKDGHFITTPSGKNKKEINQGIKIIAPQEEVIIENHLVL